MEVKLGDKVCLYRQRSVLIDPAWEERPFTLPLQIYEEAMVTKVSPKRFWVKPSSGGKQLKCDIQGGWVIYGGEDRVYANRNDQVFHLTDTYKEKIQSCSILLNNIEQIKKLKDKWFGMDIINGNYSKAKQIEILFQLGQIESTLERLEKAINVPSRVYDEKALDFL